MALSSALRPQRGFHFEYSTTVSLDDVEPGCVAYLVYVLPSDVFADKYELKQHGIPFTLHGHADLELPVAAVDNVPSVLEIRVSPTRTGQATVAFPLHARYPRTSKSPYFTVRVPEPQGFWACPSAMASSAQDVTFSRIHAPYVPAFDLDSWSVTFFDTEFHERYHEVQVPAGSPAHAQVVEFGTAFTVVVAFLYVARAVWKAAIRMRQESTHAKHE